jgi:cysteine desulfurase
MIYLDNNATTRLAPEVFAAMEPFLNENFGNASTGYEIGRESRRAIERARENVAALIGAETAEEIIFTSGGTESDNLAIRGVLEANPTKKHLVTSGVEHDAVRKTCKKIEARGYEVSWIGVDENGSLNLDQLKSSLKSETAIVSVMLANNETGVLFPMEEIASIVKANSDAIFHVDGVNAVGKIPVDLKKTAVDLFSLSGHKFHAPKGVGALYARKGIELESVTTGGGQERGRRAGTEAVHQIVGLGAAAEMAKDLSSMKKVRTLRDKLENAILRAIPCAKLNGTNDSSKRLPNTSSIGFENLNGEIILAKLNDAGICVSTGSACSSANHEGSFVLEAMGIPFSRAMGTIRFSLGRYNDEAEIDLVFAKLKEIVAKSLEAFAVR